MWMPYRVYDRDDRFCGTWYASSEAEAIQGAVWDGYDAFSAFC